MPRVNVWLPQEVYQTAKKYKVNLSQTLKGALLQLFKEMNVELETQDVPLLLLVRCPKCNYRFTTSSPKRAVCPRCGSKFVVLSRRRGSRIIKILKGDKVKLWQMAGRKVVV